MSATNPYSAPKSALVDAEIAVPDDVAKKIKSAWVAACISGTLTLGLTLLAMSRSDIQGNSAWQLVDVALIFGLAFGIYRKSRTCAILMLIYFIISKIVIVAETGKFSGGLLALVFAYYFWQGIAGTFAYHDLKKSLLGAEPRRL